MVAPREWHLAYSPADCDQAITQVSEAEESQAREWAPKTQTRDDGLLLVCDGDQAPPDDKPVFWAD